MKTALVLGAGGFIGSHLVKKLKSEGFWVRGIDLKYPEFSPSPADDFVIGDLCDEQIVSKVLFAPEQTSLVDNNNAFDEVYQLAADMGGAGYIFTGLNDADIIHGSSLINLHVAKYATKFNVKKLFYSSSACMYPSDIQEETNNQGLEESSAYPANPDSEYGWEKLFSERVYLAFNRNYGLNIRIARFHNIFGEESTYKGGKEKAPAAICRKVAETLDLGTIDIWGDGLQTRSFLHIDECLEGVRRLMNSEFTQPINIGSDEIISINDLASMAIKISGKNISINHIEGPQGVRGRNSDNTLIEEVLGWRPSIKLEYGIKRLYDWVTTKVGLVH